jgi:hypothetical protein
MRRLFLLPRYQRDAARLLDEMERHIAEAPERHRSLRAEAECGKRGGRIPGAANAVACE